MEIATIGAAGMIADTDIELDQEVLM